MKKLLIGVTLVLLVAVAYYFYTKQALFDSVQKKDIGDLVDSRADAELAAEKNELAKAAVKSPPRNSLSLPPANVPLNEIHDLLRQRADAGDGKAACRLAIELLRCRFSKNMSKYYLSQSAQNNLSGATDSLKEILSSQNAVDEERLEYLEKDKSCSNISEEQYKQAFKYLRQGANAGEPDALFPYIDGAGLATNFAAMRDRNFDAWRSDAITLADSALRRGLPESVTLLGGAYTDDFSMFAGLVENDPYQAEVMRQLYFQLFSVPPSPTSNLLTSEQKQSALRKSKELFAANFHGQVVARADASKRLRSTMTVKKDDKAPCE